MKNQKLAAIAELYPNGLPIMELVQSYFENSFKGVGDNNVGNALLINIIDGIEKHTTDYKLSKSEIMEAYYNDITEAIDSFNSIIVNKVIKVKNNDKIVEYTISSKTAKELFNVTSYLTAANYIENKDTKFNSDNIVSVIKRNIIEFFSTIEDNVEDFLYIVQGIALFLEEIEFSKQAKLNDYKNIVNLIGEIYKNYYNNIPMSVLIAALNGYLNMNVIENKPLFTKFAVINGYGEYKFTDFGQDSFDAEPSKTKLLIATIDVFKNEFNAFIKKHKSIDKILANLRYADFIYCIFEKEPI